MEHRNMGLTDVRLSVITLGCWVLGGDQWGGAEDKESIATIRTALELGISSFDTAEDYGAGRSERVLGEALRNHRNGVSIASKTKDISPDGIEKNIRESLERLRTDYLDIYYIHWPKKGVPLSATMKKMEEVKKSGRIRAIGVSNFSISQLKEALQYTVVDIVQSCYSLLWRYPEKEIVPFCIENNISIASYSSLGQGILTGKFTRDLRFAEGDIRPKTALFQPGIFERCLTAIERLKPIADKYGRGVADISIKWLLQRPGVTTAVVGARHPEQVKQNIGGTGWRLEDSDMELMEKISDDAVGHIKSIPHIFWPLKEPDDWKKMIEVGCSRV